MARDMRRTRNPAKGGRLFTVSEFLTPLQVTSFFSRLAAKVRQQSVAGLTSIYVTEGMGAMEDDATSASEEKNFARARKSLFGVVANSSSNHL